LIDWLFVTETCLNTSVVVWFFCFDYWLMIIQTLFLLRLCQLSCCCCCCCWRRRRRRRYSCGSSKKKKNKIDQHAYTSFDLAKLINAVINANSGWVSFSLRKATIEFFPRAPMKTIIHIVWLLYVEKSNKKYTLCMTINDDAWTQNMSLLIAFCSQLLIMMY
jgi:hypothetical protein